MVLHGKLRYFLFELVKNNTINPTTSPTGDPTLNPTIEPTMEPTTIDQNVTNNIINNNNNNDINISGNGNGQQIHVECYKYACQEMEIFIDGVDSAHIHCKEEDACTDMIIYFNNIWNERMNGLMD